MSSRYEMNLDQLSTGSWAEIPLQSRLRFSVMFNAIKMHFTTFYRVENMNGGGFMINNDNGRKEDNCPLDTELEEEEEPSRLCN